ncbi:MAG TPA: ABC-2 family transporter protein [Chloroflexota bacterium]|jgi:ABC-2 type transport system permease protein|nr:ABC-2 family transporter protein [Chloroflexota bacterium]
MGVHWMMPWLALPRQWKTASMEATSVTADGPLFLLDYVLRCLRVALLLSIWRIVLAGRGPVGGMSLEAVLTYTLVAEAFASPLGGRTQLIDDLWSGAIVARLLQPAGLVGQLVARMLGGWVRELSLFSVPLLLAAPLLGVNPLPAGGPAALLFGASLALGVAVGVALDFVMAALMVAWGWNRWDVDRLRAAVGAVLSGALLPLSLLPWGLGDVLTWLPFASQAWVPLSIYTGSGEVLSLLGRQLLWVAVMWPLARWLWRVNRQKVVIYGG